MMTQRSSLVASGNDRHNNAPGDSWIRRSISSTSENPSSRSSQLSWAPPTIPNTGLTGTSTIIVPFGGKLKPPVFQQPHRVSSHTRDGGSRSLIDDPRDFVNLCGDSSASPQSTSTENSLDSLSDFVQVSTGVPSVADRISSLNASEKLPTESVAKSKVRENARGMLLGLQEKGETRQRLRQYASVGASIDPKWFPSETQSSSTATATQGEQRSSLLNLNGNSPVYILLESSAGRYFDTRKRRFMDNDIEVERGSLLSSVSLTDDPDLLRELAKSYEKRAIAIKEPVFLRNVEFESVFVRVAATKILRVNGVGPSILLGIADCEVRYQVHDDFELFNFICSLRIGDAVVAQITPPGGSAGGMAREAYGRVAWMGELQADRGMQYGIALDDPSVGDMDGTWNGRRLFTVPRNGGVLCSADMLHMPREFEYRRAAIDGGAYPRASKSTSLIRNVPIKVMGAPTVVQPSIIEHPTSNALIIDMPNPPHQLTRSTTIASQPPSIPRGDCRLVPITVAGEKRSTPGHGRSPSGGGSSTASTSSAGSDARSASPGRVQLASGLAPVAIQSQPRGLRHRASTPLLEATQVELEKLDRHRETAAKETVSRVPPGGLAIGERIAWFDEAGVTRRATVRWIGDLRGHSNTYVGAEFDEPIGGGTGRHDGIELFRARPNHAGFLPLSVVMREADLDAQANLVTRAKCKPLPPLPTAAISDAPGNRDATRMNVEGGGGGKRSVDENRLIDIDDCYRDVKVMVGDAAETSGETATTDIAVGSCVEARLGDERRCGVVKWIGYVNNHEKWANEKCAAVELETRAPNDWPVAIDGRLMGSGTRLYDTPTTSNGVMNIAIVPIANLRADLRFTTPIMPGAEKDETAFFGHLDSGVVTTPQRPSTDASNLVGIRRGIQGHRNSCYLDATLYAILLNRPRTSRDIPEYEEVRVLLAEEIVYPLRQQHYVRADHIVKLRRMLSRLLPEITGFTSDEKDPEEFLIALFTRILKAKPFLMLRNRTDAKIDGAYLCPLIAEDAWTTDQLKLIDLQYLIERSMYAESVEFAEMPQSLIIQLPRYGQQKVFNKIVPLLELEITHLLYDSPRPCASCGRLADVMCPECFLTKEVLLREVTFCSHCFDHAHPSRKDADHASRPIAARRGSASRRTAVDARKLQLTAVLCIETSHYVSFVRIAGTNRWLFFDSMADRVGLEDGYNIPQVRSCDQVGAWLSATGCQQLRSTLSKDRRLPLEVENDVLVKRLLSDAYICFYSNEPLPYPPAGPLIAQGVVGGGEKRRGDNGAVSMMDARNGIENNKEMGNAKFYV